MRIRTRVALTLLASFLILFSLTFTATQLTITDNLYKLEEDKAKTQLSTALYTLEVELDAMGSKNKDWAFWNETYDYAGGTNPSYPEVNLLDETLENLEVDSIQIIGVDGTLIYSKILTYKEKELAGPVAALSDRILSHFDVTTLGDHPVAINGFTTIQQVTLMYTLQPILTATRGGPSRGILVFIRNLDEKLESKISSRLGMMLDTDHGDGSLAAPENGEAVFQRTNDYFYAEQRLPGEACFPSSYLTIMYPRTGFKAAMNSVTLFLGAFSTVAAASILFTVSMINRTILNKLSSLGRQVHDVNPKEDTMKRITLRGSDELNDLTDDVNGLIAAIEDFKVQLRERERLAAIGQTSTMIGHDLRNPLQAIFSTIFLLKRRLKGDAWSGVDPKQRAVIEQLLGVLEEQAEYMNKVVSDVQDYARNLKLEVTEIDLQQHLDSILGTIRVPATITVVNKVKGFTLKADREMLRRILTNLTLNAVQAMPEGGTLTFDACHSDGSVEITVEDSGVGIPREIMVDLFKPFYTTKSKGSGLGLAVCRRLAEAQGGYVKVESEPGKGSRFTVSFPQA